MIKALSMQNEKSFISIIIPALNSPRLANTLEALACQTSLEIIKEIIVVGQQEITEYPSFLNILNINVKEKPTPAHNRNVGAQTASGSWLVFTDSDCLPKPDWIEKLAEEISTTHKVIAGSVDIQPDMSYWGKCDHYLGFEKTAYGIAQHLSIPFAATLNFAIKRSYLRELGGFNEAFQSAGGEDRELCWRITQMGETIHFAPGAMVIHAHSRTDLASARRHIYQYGVIAGQFRIMARNNRTIILRIAITLSKIPIIGELGGFIRVLFRALTRLGNIGYLKKAPYLPGIMYLDLWHTFGILKALRENGN